MLRPCLEPGCPTLVRSGRCPECARRRATVRAGVKRLAPSRRVYTDARWLRARARAVERAGGRCQAIEDGQRCAATFRLVGHHDYEGGVEQMLRDGVDPFDERWIVVLCHRHHQQVEAWLRRAGKRPFRR